MHNLEAIPSLYLFMKIIFWNAQGAKKSQLRQQVTFMNRTIKPAILLLLETMVKYQNTDWIIKQFGCRHYSTIPSLNHVGGIWLLWNDDNTEATVIAKEPRIMHCTVLDKPTAKQCLVSTVYVPT